MKQDIHILRDERGTVTRIDLTQRGRNARIEQLNDTAYRLTGTWRREFADTLQVIGAFTAVQTQHTFKESFVRPQGGILKKGSAVSAAAYAAIASHTVIAGRQFQLAKIVVSVQNASWIQYYWHGVAISCERLLDTKTVLLEHFPLNYEIMKGEGTFEVKAKYETAAGSVNAEIVGEEATT